METQQIQLTPKALPLSIRTGILTHYIKGFKVLETCLAHGKTWIEGDNFEDKNGKACRECVEKSLIVNPNKCPQCKGSRFKTVKKDKLYACRSPFSIVVGPFRGPTQWGCGWMGNTLLTLKGESL